ncbi:MAG: amidohydrolase family protein [Actinomycetes bacterium]
MKQVGVWVLQPECLMLPSGELVSQHDLLVEGDQIAAIVPRGRVPEGAVVHEATGMTLLPGLIDSHVHLTFSADGDMVRHLVEEGPAAQTERALDNARRTIVGGVTTVFDCGGRTDVMLAVREALSGEGAQGPTTLVSGAPITTSEGHCHWLGGGADSEDEVLAMARSLAAAGVDMVKIMLTGGNVTHGSNPRMLQYPLDLLQALSRVCRELGLPLVVHAHTEAAVLMAASAGAQVVVHATCQNGDGEISLAEPTVAALLDSGIVVDATVTVGALTDFPGATPRAAYRHEQRRAMLPVFARLAVAGVPLLAGTDAGVPGVQPGRVGDAVIALHREVGIDLSAALLAATRTPAEVLGRGGQVGSLAVGMQADLLLVNGDVRSDVEAMRRVHSVWRGGRMVVSAGALLPVPEARM